MGLRQESGLLEVKISKSEPIETVKAFFSDVKLASFIRYRWRPHIAEKTYTISQFLTKFLPVPISPKEPISPKLCGGLKFL
jgi:hypothetical protein